MECGPCSRECGLRRTARDAARVECERRSHGVGGRLVQHVDMIGGEAGGDGRARAHWLLLLIAAVLRVRPDG
eukprot:2433855-Prymnesium_polylepis.2